jgi:Spy/CpxP family protein refolding chaperone
MKKTTVAGAVLATAVGLMFLANPAMAQAPESGATPQAKVKCVGANDCKGKSGCKTASSPGPGQNSCKGQGLVMTSTEQECKDKGGTSASM